MHLRFLLVLAVAGTCGVAPPGQAAESLTLARALDRALASDPVLAAERARLQAVEARAQRDALPPPFVLGAEVENIAGSGSLRGAAAAETTLRLGRVVELGGKRAARDALGEAEASQQAQRLAQARAETIGRTRARFIEALADQQRLAYAGERVEQAERTRREVEAWVRAARNPATDLRAAELAVAEARLDFEHAEHELESARMALAASWGATSPDFADVEGDLEVLPPPEPFDVLIARLPDSPEQQLRRREAETLAARRRVAEASASPDLTLGLGLRRVEGLDDQGLVLSLSVPLGSVRRATHSLAEVDAEREALEARRQAEAVEARQQLFGKVQELRHARTEMEALQGHMLPAAEQALADTRRGFEAGRFSFQALVQAQQTLFRLRERAVEAATRHHLLQAEIDRLTATPQDSTP